VPDRLISVRALQRDVVRFRAEQSLCLEIVVMLQIVEAHRPDLIAADLMDNATITAKYPQKKRAGLLPCVYGILIERD
jgi:hypothetical protein